MKRHHRIPFAVLAALAIAAVAAAHPAAAQAGGTIEGLVYADLDGDGQAGPDEPGLPGVIVRLTDENNTSKTVLTNLSGAYAFDGLSAGDYDIQVETGRDFDPTTLASYDGIAVGDDTLTGLDFGLQAETDAAQAIVDQAIEDAEANAAAAEDAADDATDGEGDEADEADEAMDEGDEAAESDEADEADAEDAAGDDMDGEGDEADAGDDEAMSAEGGSDGDGDGDGGTADADDVYGDDEADEAEGADEAAAGPAGPGKGGGAGYPGLYRSPVGEMPETGFEDMGLGGLLAALAAGMAAVAGAGVWRERRAYRA